MADFLKSLKVKGVEIDTAGATTNQVLTYNGTKFAPASAAGGGSTATVSDTAPPSPTSGQIWYESDTGATFVYTGSAWVEVGATQGPYVCTSTTRPSSPYEGQLIYETDTDRILVYNSSAWVMMVAAGAPPGLQLIKTQTFTAQSTQQFTSIFTSDYANYRCSLDLTASTGTNFYIRFLVGTTVQTGNILSTNLYNQLSAGSLSKNTRSDQYGLIGAAFATYTSNYIIEWMNPQVADYTSYYANGVGGRSNTDSDFNQTFSRNIATTQIDGFEITTAGAPTLTGTLRVYGYRNSI